MERRKRMKKVILLVCLVLLFSVVSAKATIVHTDNFNVAVDSQGNVVSGGGSGGAEWYRYPNHNWTNIWFYDDPFDPQKTGKIVSYSMTVSPLDPTVPSTFQYTLNWTTAAWSALNRNGPPLPPLSSADEALYIGREPASLLYSWGPVVQPGETPKSFDLSKGTYELPIRFNPEWISVDIRGTNFQITNGVIIHECVPEPATMALLGLGSFAMAIFRKRSA